MKINEKEQSVIELLSSDERLSNTVVFKAYDNRICKEDESLCLVAVSMLYDAKLCQIGSNENEQIPRLHCYIYVPISRFQELEPISQIVCGDVFDNDCISVSVSENIFDNDTRMYKKELTFSYYDSVIFD